MIIIAVFSFLFLHTADIVNCQGAIDDKIILKDGLVKQINIDDNGQEWLSSASVTKIEVLNNDKFPNSDIQSCRKTPTSTPSSGSITFKEIAQAIGIKHQHRLTDPIAPSCTFDKFLKTVNSSAVHRLKGQYCDPDHATGGVASGDYDNDGYIDLFFTVFNGNSVLYRNNGDGTFTDVTSETGVGPVMYGNGAGFFDADQDGDLDLYVTTLGDNRHYLYINYGGHFKEEAMLRYADLKAPNKRALGGMTPNFGDYDNDGYLDIYVSEVIRHDFGYGLPSRSRLLHNRGAANPGYFEDMTEIAGVNFDNVWSVVPNPVHVATFTFGSSFTDFDNDGYPELLISADFDQSRLFWNNKDGTFRECTLNCGINQNGDNAMGLAIGDFNNDGKPDWFSSAIYENMSTCGPAGNCDFPGTDGNTLYINNGDGTFSDVTAKAGVANGGFGWGAVYFDFNNDGYLDIIQTNGLAKSFGTSKFFYENMRLFENTKVASQPGNVWTMKEAAVQYDMHFHGQGRGLIKVDFDNDGDEDVIVAANKGHAQIFRNEGGNQGNWLKVVAKNRCLQNSNKLCESYGAVITVVHDSGRQQMQEVGSSSHYLGQSERDAHFGLGSSSNTVTVTIKWPAQNVMLTVNLVPVNTVLRVVRPASTQQVSYVQLNQCPQFSIQSVTQQPQGMVVEVSADKRSLSLVVADNTNNVDIGLKTFQYSITMSPNPNELDGFIKTATVTLDLRASKFSGCPMAAVHSVTDERRFDGISNNKAHLTWGSPNTELKRVAPSDYSDGVEMPAGGCGYAKISQNACPYPKHYSGYGSTRPSSRHISNTLFAQPKSILSARRMNDMTMHFGQFFSHDIDLTVELPKSTPEVVPNGIWMQVAVPKGDTYFDPMRTGNKYLTFLRSVYNKCSAVYPTGLPRQQLNAITSFIDAGNVYGSNYARSQELRLHMNGKMKQGTDGILPKNVNRIPIANHLNRDAAHLYMAGDVRVNVQPGLMAMHSLFVREHNRHCEEYMKDNPNASDEEIFQYARRFVIAELQSIAYNEYLPSLFGGKTHIPDYTGYKVDTDPAVDHLFATAAFRYGHSQVNTELFRLDANFHTSEYGHALLRDCYHAPEKLSDEGGLDPLLRGMMYFPAQEMDTHMVDDMRNLLFTTGYRQSIDLAVLNIERGRDHGLPDYNTARKLMGFEGVKDFSEISSNTEVAEKLKELYKTVDNIDLWVGGLSEDHEEGSEMGKTFRAILMATFLRLRNGDRFWYQNIMSSQEIKKVEAMTLAKMIQMNTGFQNVPSFSFFAMDSCSDVKDFQCVRKESEDVTVLKTENVELKMLVKMSHADYLNAKKYYKEADKDKDDFQSLSIGLGVVAGFFIILSLLLLLVLLINFCRRKRETKSSTNYKVHDNRSSPSTKSDLGSRNNGFAYP